MNSAVGRFARDFAETMRVRQCLVFSVGEGAMFSLAQRSKREGILRGAELASLHDPSMVRALSEPPAMVRLVVLPLRASMKNPGAVIGAARNALKALLPELREKRDKLYTSERHTFSLPPLGLEVQVLWGSPDMYNAQRGLMQGVFVNKKGLLPAPEDEAFLLFFELVSLKATRSAQKQAHGRAMVRAIGALSLMRRPEDAGLSLLEDVRANLHDRLQRLIGRCRWWNARDVAHMHRLAHEAARS